MTEVEGQLQKSHGKYLALNFFLWRPLKCAIFILFFRTHQIDAMTEGPTKSAEPAEDFRF